MSDADFASLPPHLLKLVPLLAEGATNADMAETLVLSQGTIEQYVSELKGILGVEDRAQLVLACFKFAEPSPQRAELWRHGDQR